MKVLATALLATALSWHPTPARLGVGAQEFHLVLSRPAVKSGRVEIELQNDGEDVHDLRVRRIGGTRTYRVPATRQGEMVSSTATFSASGDYMLRIQANDESGEGGAGFQCCWTNALVKVTVR